MRARVWSSIWHRTCSGDSDDDEVDDEDKDENVAAAVAANFRMTSLNSMAMRENVIAVHFGFSGGKLVISGYNSASSTFNGSPTSAWGRPVRLVRP